MKKFIDQILRAANQFKAVDYAIFKIYLVAVGTLLGSYFAQFWLSHITIVWVVTCLSAIYVIYRLCSK